MGVYITGDCHGDFKKFSTDSFPEQKGLSRDDFVIVCGDFGLWHDTKDERYWLNWLQSKPFTLLFVDGNHENFDRLYSDEFPIIDFHGGKVHKIRENVYHYKKSLYRDFNKRTQRGEMLRINHSSWWKEELPSEQEMEFGLKTLDDNSNKVDFIVTHCCPQQVASMLSGGFYEADSITRYFNVVAETVEFSRWFFGHYHGNEAAMSKFILLYEQIVRCV